LQGAKCGDFFLDLLIRIASSVKKIPLSNAAT
jgi:hypothetical protein